jgi:hypothetical protein
VREAVQPEVLLRFPHPRPLPEVEGVLSQVDTPLEVLDSFEDEDDDDDDELEPPPESFDPELDSFDDELDSFADEPDSLDDELDSFAAAPSLDGLAPLVAVEDDRESVMYHPLPLNTMPTG